MNRFAFALLIASLAIAAEGFSPLTVQRTRTLPYYANVVDKIAKANDSLTTRRASNVESVSSQTETKEAAPKKKAGTSHAKKGPLAPFVVLAKKLLGEEELNQLRGKVIAEHSKVIGGFVDTSKTEFGESVLRALFELADTNKNGTIEEEELAAALRVLGFDLRDKQIKGIFDRADKDENGAIDYEEWRKEAPNTLRTNLIKLAKRNGGDLGFLA